MLYDKILARSFSKQEQKKLGYGAFVVCLVLALSICSVFKQYLEPQAAVSLLQSMDAGLKKLVVKDTDNSKQAVKGEEIVERAIFLPESSNNVNISYQETEIVQKKVRAVCNLMEIRSDFCEINDRVRIHGNLSSVFFPEIISGMNTSWHIRPYARKGDGYALSSVRNWTIKSVSEEEMPQCHHNHNAPAILFSVAGYSGNYFHSISDIIVPLYITSRPFNREVQFIITDDHRNPLWTSNFQAFLTGLSMYEPMSIDKVKDVHCFPSVIVGLQHHKPLGIDPLRSSYSMKEFRKFLRTSQSLRKLTAIKLRVGVKKMPRLLIVARKQTRRFINMEEIVRMAKSLGYKVIVAEPESNSMSKFAQIVNSCDVMMGVHGAGLTNLIYLPDNAILIQVLGLGDMQWLGHIYFELPSKDMNLSYLEYKIMPQESTLIQQYPPDHEIIRNPFKITDHGWGNFKKVYLDNQDVKLDVNRFRFTLLKALELLHQ